MLVTAGGTTTILTVTRGYNGTTAASHANGQIVIGITSMKMTLNTTVGATLTLAYAALTNGTLFWMGNELCQVTSGGGTSAITFTRNLNKLSTLFSDIYGYNTTSYSASLVDLMYLMSSIANPVYYSSTITPVTGILPTSASVATGSYLLGNYAISGSIGGVYDIWREYALVLSSTGSGPYYNTIQRGTGATGLGYGVSVGTGPFVAPFNFAAVQTTQGSGGAGLLGATQFYINPSTTNLGGAGGSGVCIVSWFE
jgi:hypothetical protein